MEEVWKDVVGYEPYFMVSNIGNVWSKRTGRLLKLFVRKDRRVTVATKIGGRSGNSIVFKVHRLVAEAFIPNPENKPQVNHIDGDPTNNSVCNLEWATPSENILHAHENGLITPRRSHTSPLSTLSEFAVGYIRDNPESKTIRELASLFGVHHSTVSRCKNFQRYK